MKFPRKFSLVFVFVAMMIVGGNSAWADAQNVQAQKKTEVTSVACDPGKPVLFAFRDNQGKYLARFSIPEGYIENQPNLRSGDTTRIINLRVWKKDFTPDCGRLVSTNYNQNNFIMMTLHRHTDFDRVIYAHGKTYSEFIRHEGVTFDVYRSKRAVLSGKLQASSDLLVPQDSKESKSFFIECAHPLGAISSESWTGCSSYAKITDSVYVEYYTDHTDLPHYKDIEEKVRQFVLGLMIKDIDERKN